jgi:cytochrome c biogenesis protein CcmG/thiol:disulfide interchange protein DsbE
MKFRSSIIVLAVVAGVGLLTYGLLSKGEVSIAQGDEAPALTLPNLDGKGQQSLADYRGKWVLLNFWASWCGPCRAESPALEKFQEAHGNPNFTIVGVDTRDLSDDGEAFLKKYGVSYPQMRDANGDAAHDFGTTGVPENFLIDPKGRLRLLVRGPITEEYLEEQVAPLLPAAKGKT